MLKWILSALSLVFGYKIRTIDIKGIASEVIDDAIFMARKPAAMMLLGICSILFFCGGAFVAIFDATRQYDTTGTVAGTATLWTGAGIAMVFAVAYVWAFLVAWPGARKHAHKVQEVRAQAKKDTVGLDQAISTFIMDVVEERRADRAMAREARANAYAKASHTEKRKTPPEDEPPRGFA
ncbi:hypothetical protein [Bdellovibrio sp. HCB2-146]|uniref:hypothetical protein n=1 Tax=Bdellovibrio sp. HCB2-146 TaxID=3394362 RepID=UPI0039BCA1A8